MTIRSVREASPQANTNDPRDRFATAQRNGAETPSVIKAPGPKVSAGEQKPITDLFERGVSAQSGDVLKGNIQEILNNFGFGTLLSAAPRFAGRPVRIQIRDHRPAHGDLVEAYLDRPKNQFYIKSTISGKGGAETIVSKWFGPTSVDAGLSAKKRQEMTAVLQKADKMGLLEWRPVQLPLRDQFYRAELYREKHPNECVFSALIPVAAHAPDAPRQDPDKVDSFIAVRDQLPARQGGSDRMTWVAGPIHHPIEAKRHLDRLEQLIER